jgi:potassium efflux system protein
MLVVVLTITAARNLPGMLEIAILEKLPFDPSVRYAVQAISRYVIVVIGIIVVSHLLGLNSSSVQWLAAALTFGLGFGLQEIFANFISGLIILFERPVRVGDVVTIDNVSGAVSRIRMRSTTILDWDRKEYIVPNKEFITGKLLNWTLSDTLNRVVIPVGVAYNSDPERVRRIILEVVQSHENVLADPPVSVGFDGFGDSALNFTVRAFLPDLSHRLDTIHDLHTRIFVRFAEEGIEIPFPQQDLHVRSIPRTIARLLEQTDSDAA